MCRGAIAREVGLTESTMDLIDVRGIRMPTTRAELFLTPDRPLAGGTWIYSVRQSGTSHLVDLMSLDWPTTTTSDGGLAVSATCTVAELSRFTPPELRTDPVRAGNGTERFSDPRALFWQCANSFLAPFKVWNVATVGGNIALALPAGPMISLAVSLDAIVVIWAPDGGERRMPVAEFVTGVLSTDLRPGEIVREILVPPTSLAATTGFRRIALNALGRTGTLVIARVDESGEAVFTVSGGTSHPEQARFDRLPSARALEERLRAIDSWYTDAHGPADWREEMSVRFAEQLRVELGGAL